MNDIRCTAFPKQRLSRHDKVILMLVSRAWALNDDVLADWEVGIRNEDGHFYRRCSVSGVKQLLFLTDELEKMGFLRDDSTPPLSGFDVTFTHPR